MGDYREDKNQKIEQLFARLANPQSLTEEDTLIALDVDDTLIIGEGYFEAFIERLKQYKEHYPNTKFFLVTNMSFSDITTELSAKRQNRSNDEISRVDLLLRLQDAGIEVDRVIMPGDYGYAQSVQQNEQALEANVAAYLSTVQGTEEEKKQLINVIGRAAKKSADKPIQPGSIFVNAYINLYRKWILAEGVNLDDAYKDVYEANKGLQMLSGFENYLYCQRQFHFEEDNQRVAKAPYFQCLVDAFTDAAVGKPKEIIFFDDAEINLQSAEHVFKPENQDSDVPPCTVVHIQKGFQDDRAKEGQVFTDIDQALPLPQGKADTISCQVQMCLAREICEQIQQVFAGNPENLSENEDENAVVAVNSALLPAQQSFAPNTSPRQEIKQLADRCMKEIAVLQTNKQDIENAKPYQTLTALQNVVANMTQSHENRQSQDLANSLSTLLRVSGYNAPAKKAFKAASAPVVIGLAIGAAAVVGAVIGWAVGLGFGSAFTAPLFSIGFASFTAAQLGFTTGAVVGGLLGASFWKKTCLESRKWQATLPLEGAEVHREVGETKRAIENWQSAAPAA
jgi:hypothetical protein